jgi:hypothetical protein
MDDIPFLAVEGTTEPGRPRTSKTTLGLVSINRGFFV